MVGATIKEDMYESNQKIDNVRWELITFEDTSVGKLDGKPTKNTFDFV